MSRGEWNPSIAVALSCAAAPVAALSTGCAEVAAEEDFDESAVRESSAGFSPIAPCLSAADYVPRAVVQFGPGGSPYKMPCTRLATGGTVVFQGPFAAHPLVPSGEGTVPSPIQYTDGGGWAEFEFPDVGFFAYHCEAHPNEKGVVWASWAF